MTKKLKIKGDVKKKGGEVALAHQAVVHPSTIKGEDVDVSTLNAATIVCFHAPVEAVPNTNPGRFLIQVSGIDAGDDDWATIAEHRAAVVTAATESITAVGAGQTVLLAASTAGFAAEDGLYIQDVSKVSQSEWQICKNIDVDTSIDIIDELSYEKDTGDIAWNGAEIFITQIDLTSVIRIRVIFQHEGAAGANAHVRALMTISDVN